MLLPMRRRVLPLLYPYASSGRFSLFSWGFNKWQINLIFAI